MSKKRYLVMVVGVVLVLIVGCSNADQENIVQASSNAVIQDIASGISSILSRRSSKGEG